ncbi:MAG: hypothetical protein L3J92_03545 [Thermoplasmata archaeon]|jgi:hypothetical protein|nr:hypothetical protein [Thermoplasmata archaeon]
MGWGGIKNIPPGFDVFGGKQGPTNIVEEAIGGHVLGLIPGNIRLFADLKRNLLHQDYARYFDSCLVCSNVLTAIEDGRYVPQVLKDIVEPALATAIEQMESIEKDAAQSHASHRKMQYDPLPSLEQLHLKSRPIALAYPHAARAPDLDVRYREISDSVRRLTST